jgi:hypothetical protein
MGLNKNIAIAVDHNTVTIVHMQTCEVLHQEMTSQAKNE